MIDDCGFAPGLCCVLDVAAADQIGFRKGVVRVGAYIESRVLAPKTGDLKLEETLREILQDHV